MSTAAGGRRRRLTRAESRERTRALIVDAATALFLRDGFASTSLDEVAEEAGFTRGAVYSNFDSKIALGIAVIDELYAAEAERVRLVLSTLEDVEQSERLEQLAGWLALAEGQLGDEAWMRLEIEITAASAQDETFRTAAAARYARLRAVAGEVLDALFGPDALGETRELLATAFVGLSLGIGVQRGLDPGFPGSYLGDALRLFVDAARAAPRSPAAPPPGQVGPAGR